MSRGDRVMLRLSSCPPSDDAPAHALPPLTPRPPSGRRGNAWAIALVLAWRRDVGADFEAKFSALQIKAVARDPSNISSLLTPMRCSPRLMLSARMKRNG
jgi:hypothetical protein